MSIKNDFKLTRDNINLYLKEVAREYKRINRSNPSAEVIIVGGASILLNYSFRDSTTDVDAFVSASSSLKDAVNKVTDKYGLPYGWLNSDFERTSSFSTKLIQYSKHYRTFYNSFEVRTVSGEYLIAMKLKSGRKYKNDLSDIVGILAEQTAGKELSLKMIIDAYNNLYGDWNMLDEDIRSFITALFDKKGNSIRETYDITRENEQETKKLLIQFENDNPGRITSSNINEILNKLKK